MDGEKCHRKTPKNHSKPVKFLTVRFFEFNDSAIRDISLNIEITVN